MIFEENLEKNGAIERYVGLKFSVGATIQLWNQVSYFVSPSDN